MEFFGEVGHANWTGVVWQHHFSPWSHLIIDQKNILAKMGAKTTEGPRVRSAALARDTNETKIQLAINLDGGEFPAETDERLTNGSEGHATQASKSQTIAINSGIGFLDHMLHALAKHAGWSLALNCKGDLHSKFFAYLKLLCELMIPPS